ncbi:MAG: type IV toxin-antitoxin system AbiEi family antitoxin domain-containing protein [Solirubrobacterales bacterium]|nr:type IV toxin-antitoxin system AbiEi family antitoxin domain-containing protein [Solirubrobacterales bacterium]
MAEAGRISDNICRSFAQPAFDAAIACLAARQHGVVGLNQLCELGLSARAIQHRARVGRLHRIYPGVYSLVPASLLKREGRWMAAALAGGPGAVVSHRTAAALNELMRTERTKIDVTILGRTGRKHPGLDIHRSTTLTAADTTNVNGIPCTTVARTLFDLGEVIDGRRLERAFDQAEILEILDMRAIEDQVCRNATRPAAQRVKRVLEAHYIGSTPTESEIEEAFLALCRRARLPQPEVQQWLHLPDGGPPIRADFLWRHQRVVVETDGDRYHGTHQAARRDARRDQRLTVHRFKPIRTGWRQIFYRPAELEATLRALVLS